MIDFEFIDPERPRFSTQPACCFSTGVSQPCPRSSFVSLVAFYPPCALGLAPGPGCTCLRHNFLRLRRTFLPVPRTPLCYTYWEHDSSLALRPCSSCPVSWRQQRILPPTFAVTGLRDPRGRLDLSLIQVSQDSPAPTRADAQLVRGWRDGVH